MHLWQAAPRYLPVALPACPLLNHAQPFPQGYQAAAIKCDVRVREDVEAAVTAAVQIFGGLDIAVANAGMLPCWALCLYIVSTRSVRLHQT